MKASPASVQRVFTALAVASFALTLSDHVATQGRSPRGTTIVNGHEAVAGEVLVKFVRSLSAGDQLQLVQDLDVEEREEVGENIQRIRSRGLDVETLLSILRAQGTAAYAEPNYILHTTATPNDPQFGNLWGLLNTGQTINGSPGVTGADIHATSAWDLTTGSKANVVTVVDTGIDYSHPDLAANVWSAPAPFSVTIGGTTISCAAGTHGFNAIANTCDPKDDNNHGTHVSGTIGGAGNNGIGVAGVNWTASIMGSKFLDATGSGSLANAIKAIEFAIQAKNAFASTAGANVRVLSNSWGGGGFSQGLLDEINKANTNNMLFVAAAGNSASNNDVVPSYPASYNAPNVIAVAASNNQDQLASFSNFGSTVALAAPGVDVLSTTINNTYQFFSGTSMATPHVSGAAALILSKCSLDTAGVKAAIINNVDVVGALTGRVATNGRLNVDKALRACAAPATPGFTLAASPASQSVTQGASTSYTVTVTPSGGFTGTVTFSAGGLPTGAAATFNPSSVTGAGTATMTVTTVATTPTGTFPLTITATSGGLQRMASVSLTVNAAPTDFSLSPTPASRAITQGASTTYTVTVTPSGGFTGTVTFSAGGLPTGAAATFNPSSVTGAGTSTMTVTTVATTPTGTFPLSITGTSGSLTHSTSVSLTVNAPVAADFSVSATPSSTTVSRGDPASYTVTVTPSGGFSGAVAFSVSGLPADTSASFSPSAVTTSGASTMTVSTSDPSPFGTFPLTITASGGGRQHSVVVMLTIVD